MWKLYENIHGEVENVSELYKREQSSHNFEAQLGVSKKDSTEDLNRQLIEVTKKYDDIVNSTCWKLTYPIRVILNGIRKIMGKI